MSQVVKRRRQELGLSQRELGKKASTTSTAIHMIEAGSHNLTIRYLLMLSAALGIHPGEFFPRTAVRTSARLSEVAEVLSDAIIRMNVQIRAVERIVSELHEEAAASRKI